MARDVLARHWRTMARKLLGLATAAAPIGPLASQRGGLIGARRNVNRRVWRSVLSGLTAEQREGLRRASGNHTKAIEASVARLARALLNADTLR